MTIVLTSAKRIDWARPEGCPAGFEPEFVVVGNSDAGDLGAITCTLHVTHV